MKYSRLFQLSVGGILLAVLVSYLPSIVSPAPLDPVRLTITSEEGIGRTRLFLGVLCLFLFWLLLFLSGTHRTKLNQLKAGWAVLITALIVVGVNFVVNPRGYYPIELIKARVEDSRKTKLDLYRQSAKDQQIIILGSSRSYSFSPAYIQEVLKYSAFNFSVLNGRFVDFLIISNYVFDQANTAPDILIVEVPPFDTYEPDVSLTNTSRTFLPYMDREWVVEYFRIRAEGLLSSKHFSEAVYTLFYQLKFSESSLPWLEWTVSADGGANRPTNPYFNEVLQRAIDTKEISCSLENVDLQTLNLERLAQLAEESGTAVIFIKTPWQSAFYHSVLADSESYQQCAHAYNQFFLGLENRYDDVYFQDFSDLSTVKGNATALGFYDQQHLTPLNANLVIDALAKTINEIMAEKP